MLATKYIYTVHKGQDGYYHVVVTRLSDGMQKYFFQCVSTMEGMTRFFKSMTDELTDSYFPRTDKKGKQVGGVDNWQYLGDNPDRAVVEEQARQDLVRYRLANP